MSDLDKRAKVNKIIRLLCEKKDDFYSDSTLEAVLKLIDTSNRVVDINEELGVDFDE